MFPIRFAGWTPAFVAGLLVLVTGCADSGPAAEERPSGEALFAENCAVCHSLPLITYLFDDLSSKPPGYVYDAISEGSMRRVGSRLDEHSRRAIAEFFTGTSFASNAARREMAVSPPCSPEEARFDWGDKSHTSWGGSLRNHRRIEDGKGLRPEAIELLSVQWVVALPEATQLRSHPTAAGGALFVGSHNGSVYSLDQATGCTRWHFKAATEVRSAVTIDVAHRAGQPPLARAFFADRAANVYALDAVTGRLLWKTSVDPHLTAAVTGSVSAHAGRLFVPISSNEDVAAIDPRYPCCTHSGAVVALDAGSGEILWRTPTIVEEPQISGANAAGTPIWGPSGASVWNTPTIDESLGLLFVGSGNNHSRPASARSDSILAMDLETGEVVWTYQGQAEDAWNTACILEQANRISCPEPIGPDTDFGATTMLVEQDRRKLVIAGQKSGTLHAIEAATGELRWKLRLSRGGVRDGIRFGMATRDGVLFVPSTDTGDHRRAGLAARPGFFALSARDGSILWERTGEALCAGRENCEGAVGAPPLVMAEAVFAADLDGVVHALDRRTGASLWQFDSAREFTTLMGQTTRGGGIDGTAGPMFANGRLFVSSGYGQSGRPGNALIALAPQPTGVQASAP
ncbi:MAG: PQQ-binding-like beta-propeller repeat protein [Deltaproteobacteria bacterium]|nr:PQQ-binding-like beta-propeller repeat protein [Deltaproteobacteria bacterium]